MQSPNDYSTIDTSGALRDIAILQNGSTEQMEEVAARLNEDLGGHMPPVFVALARRFFAQGDAEEAYFWFCFGRLRGRYDAERCADVTARTGIDAMIMDVEPELRRYFATIDPEGIVTFGQQVLDLDAETPHDYDHRWIALHGMGAFGRGGPEEISLSEAEWPRLLQETREEFRASLEQAAAQLKAAKEQ